MQVIPTAAMSAPFDSYNNCLHPLRSVLITAAAHSYFRFSSEKKSTHTYAYERSTRNYRRCSFKQGSLFNVLFLVITVAFLTQNASSRINVRAASVLPVGPLPILLAPLEIGVRFF